MVLSALGRANLDNRWKGFISTVEGKRLFDLSKASLGEQQDSIVRQIIERLRTSVEVDYHHNTLAEYIREKIDSPVVRRM